MTDPAAPDPAPEPVAPGGPTAEPAGGDGGSRPASGTRSPRSRSTSRTTRTPAAAGGEGAAKAPAPRRKPASTRAASSGAGKAETAGDGTAAPAGSKAATPSRAKRPSSTTSTERRTAERPKRTTSRAAAAQSAPDTVRPPRAGKAGTPVAAAPDVPAAAPTEAGASGDPSTALPNEADLAPTRLLPPVRPAAARSTDDETTETIPPAAAPPDGADATTEILHPAAPPSGADATTELLLPGEHPAAERPDAPPAHLRGQRREPVGVVAEPDREAAAERPDGPETVLKVRGLSKRFGDTLAVDRLDLDVRAGSFAGIVGPNGAGKTTTLSMVTGLLRPDVGTVHVHGIDVWQDPDRAKRTIGVLPDALRLFDRLTGAQLLHYSGVLRGLDAATVRERSADLVQAFGLEDATGRMVADYSAGMTKKIALAAAMIHSPRLLVLDEPFESVDPVSAANIIEILRNYVASGGTVVLSSHGMDLIQRVCDHVAIVVGGRVLAAGTTDEVRGAQSLEDRFVELAGGRKAAKGMEWLHSFSD